MTLPDRPLTVLIAALGGEGGGVMADWLVDAATAHGYPVQSTSIPGVAQRTGATTYYIEIYPVRRDELAGREPVFALTPSPGNVDVMVASELLEAGRAMQNGYVSPQRTTLVASTHRIYSIAEKSAMADGRFDGTRIVAAARELARRAVLLDMAALAQQSGTVINAVLFGALAGSGALPLSRELCEQAIRKTRGAEASLRGFAAGYAGASAAEALAEPAPRKVEVPAVGRVQRDFPAETRNILEHGVARLTDYQDAAYADDYLGRLAPLLAIEREAGGAATGYPLTNAVGRQLALWMSYEDVIRVADLKTRRARFERIRAEAGAQPGEPVIVTDFLKPGVEEFCSVLPRSLGSKLRNWAARRAKPFAFGLRVKTSSVSGFLLLRLLAWLKPLRRSSLRFHEEQALIACWLEAVTKTARSDAALALEIAECARLIKGYGDTHQRGRGNFLRIFERLVEADSGLSGPARIDAIRKAREQALSDPDGSAAQRPASTVKPVVWLTPQRAREMQDAGR